MATTREMYMILTTEQEVTAKYIVLLEWAGKQLGEDPDVISKIIDDSFDKNMKGELEEYCRRLYDE